MVLKIIRIKKTKLHQGILIFLFSWQIQYNQDNKVNSVERKTETVYNPALFSHVISKGA